MLTTDTKTPPVVLRAAAVSALAAGVVVVVAAVAGGGSAAAGAAVGGAIAVGVLAFGALAVDAVSRLMPAASLLFAMVTYTFQVVLLALVFVALHRSGLLDRELDRNWLGGAIIAGVLVWTVVQIRLATTARIPAFDSPAVARPEGGAR